MDDYKPLALAKLLILSSIDLAWAVGLTCAAAAVAYFLVGLL